MKTDDSIGCQDTLEALLDKGQHSRRYKLGDIWELNFDEIREVINALPAVADPNSYALGYMAGFKAGLKNAQKAIESLKE